MKASHITPLLLALAPAIARPTDYTPPGGWDSVEYPDGTGEHLPYYSPPPGGWDSVEYPHPDDSYKNYGKDYKPGDWNHEDAKHDWQWKSPFFFTSVFHVVATGAEVVSGSGAESKPAPGPADAIGFFNYGINSITDTICWNITVINVPGEFASPANTATHIHQGPKGQGGPPRVTFSNPVPLWGDHIKQSVGCKSAPFKTGIMVDGKDTGDGFKLSQIEADPKNFFTDVHTDIFTAGAVRGQLG
ncbi:hypothetical protein ABW19_dt0208366 [Dactylella cylindrospora]|nr:hypothetical protein ABW19_dt0208366 [Dactylella cylindrospora]